MTKSFFTNKISLDEIITLRGILNWSDGTPITCRWRGVCQETADAMSGRSDHRVVRRGNIVEIWRDGYVRPHFISLDWGVTFFAPFF